MKNKNILYVGNNLFKKNNYSTSYDILNSALKYEGFNLYNTSSISNKFFRLIAMCYDVIRYSKKVKYVLIDTYSTSNFYYALLTSQICRILKLKYLPILHGGNLPNRLKDNPLLSSLIFNNSFQNIAPSGYLKFEFEKKGYATLLIPNVIPVSYYTFKERKKITPKLLYVRAFAKIYNPTMAIEVLKELKKTYSKAVLCMVGPDKDGTLNDVQQLIDKYQLHHSVEITGVLSKDIWHKKSEDFDIFINTTNVDNTPISVVEAMALGLTVVSTNAGGLPYLIDNGKEGFLVEKNQSFEMVKKIDNIIRENSSYIAKNARIKVNSFDWSVVRRQWLKLLQ
ncbi:glycosyltransferase family 4 protein [Flavobacteriaceae bacterium]|nr:glycosyltransferase family 4 protein [Flavobacteriaceae bacterium]